MAEMMEGKGLPEGSESYQKMAEMGGEKRLILAARNCQKRAEMRGEKGCYQLPECARKWQKWGGGEGLL